VGGAGTNESLFERACRVSPGGVNSPVRAFRAVGGTPYFVARGEGAYVWDVEGNRYIDYVQSYGASLLGHAHPEVVEAIRRAAGRGTTFGAPTEGEVLLAEEICGRVPGCQLVRLVSSGTEAAMTTIRLARGATGRDRVVLFSGCYHGHSDALLAGGGSGVATLGLSTSAGVPAGSVAETLVAPYNRVPEIGSDVAAVIVEPVAANMGLVPPAPGFLEGLRQACTRAGALLIFDEVITGFRVGPGGASRLFGVTPDLWCFGKVIGGGLPLAAFGGRRDVMEQLAPLGPVYQAGTLSGNPVAVAAGLAVLSLLDDGVYKDLATWAGRLGAGLAAAAAEAGLAVQVPVVGPLVGVFFGPATVTDYEGARASTARGLYPPIMHGLLERGVAIAPGPYEVLFLSLAHSEADLERTVEAFGQAARQAASDRP
jgi:glutamate-1-semialdehyde 2,1-aminomutase